MSTRVKRVMLIGIDAMQLCQVQRFAEQGALPNFSRLLSMGSAGELLPEAPAWTPTNWGTIATGSLPGSTRLAGWFRRINERDLQGSSDISTFSSEACPTDTIWAAAERAGLRTLSIFYPLTWPPTTENGMVVAPLYSGPGITPLDISKSRVWTTRQDRIFRSEPLHVTSEGPRWAAEVTITPSTMELAKEFNFGDKPEDAREKVASASGRSLKAVFDPASKTAEVFAEDGQTIGSVSQGAWSDWAFLEFGDRGKGSVRFYLASCAEDADLGFTLAHSAVYPTQGFTFPASIAEELVTEVGPFVPFPTFLPGEEGDRAWFDEYEYQGLWMARSAAYLQDTRGWDLYCQHYHAVDSAMHKWQHFADPSSGSYDPDLAEYAEKMIRRVYEVSDTMLGAFMELMNGETALIAVSDHGCIPSKWEVDYSRILETAGFLVRDKGGVVWEKSKAFMISQRIGDIYINAEGRFPQGSVAPSDYERVQEEIIDALLDLRNPDGKRVVAYALKRKDAEIVGHYGPETGDVVFMLNSFHGRGSLPEGQSVRRARGSSNHATMLPTTRTGFSSDLAAAIIAGPGIRSGYVRDDRSMGLWRLTDIAPTISKMLDIEPPHDSRGAVMYDLFE